MGCHLMDVVEEMAIVSESNEKHAGLILKIMRMFVID